KRNHANADIFHHVLKRCLLRKSVPAQAVQIKHYGFFCADFKRFHDVDFK
ncbi:MAG: hypothetical protein ACI9FR_002987, partial [Cryomorphaceae bacterium]